MLLEFISFYLLLFLHFLELCLVSGESLVHCALNVEIVKSTLGVMFVWLHECWIFNCIWHRETVWYCWFTLEIVHCLGKPLAWGCCWGTESVLRKWRLSRSSQLFIISIPYPILHFLMYFILQLPLSLFKFSNINIFLNLSLFLNHLSMSERKILKLLILPHLLLQLFFMFISFFHFLNRIHKLFLLFLHSFVFLFIFL